MDHAPQPNWQPRLTGYDILVVGLTVGFGLSKAVLSYHGQTTIPTTLDWLYAVAIVLLLQWLGLYKYHSALRFPWLFDFNYLSFLRRPLVTDEEQPFQPHDLPNPIIFPIQEQLPVTNRWHPKLTGFRLIVAVLTTGFGLAKAVLTYHGQAIAPTTLEWVFGVVVSLGLYFLGLIESNHTLPWLYEKDYASYLWGFLSLCSWPPPLYRTDQRNIVMLIKRRHPPITGYRLLVIIMVVGFGLAKAILMYQGHSAAPTSLDWVSGVVITLSLYWLGLYEYNSVGKMSALFDTDYTTQTHAILVGGEYLLWLVVNMVFAGWTYFWIQSLFFCWSAKTSDFDTSSPSPSTVDTVVFLSVKLWVLIFVFVVTSAGIIRGFVVFRNFVRVVLLAVEPLAKYIGSSQKIQRLRRNSMMRRLGRLCLLATPRIRNILRRLWLVLQLLGYTIVLVITWLMCAALFVVWAVMLVTLWEELFFSRIYDWNDPLVISFTCWSS